MQSGERHFQQKVTKATKRGDASASFVAFVTFCSIWFFGCDWTREASRGRAVAADGKFGSIDRSLNRPIGTKSPIRRGGTPKHRGRQTRKSFTGGNRGNGGSKLSLRLLLCYLCCLLFNRLSFRGMASWRLDGRQRADSPELVEVSSAQLAEVSSPRVRLADFNRLLARGRQMPKPKTFSTEGNEGNKEEECVFLLCCLCYLLFNLVFRVWLDARIVARSSRRGGREVRFYRSILEPAHWHQVADPPWRDAKAPRRRKTRKSFNRR